MRYILLITLIFMACNGWADWFEDYKKQIVEMEHPSKELIREFPFLQIFDEYLEATSGIRWFECKDRDTGQTIYAGKFNYFNPLENWKFWRTVDDFRIYWEQGSNFFRQSLYDYLPGEHIIMKNPRRWIGENGKTSNR